jgi:ankyrin repeat protein
MKNKNGETPLCMACRKHLYSGVILLLVNSNHHMLHVKDDDGATPLHYGKCTDCEPMKIF